MQIMWEVLFIAETVFSYLSTNLIENNLHAIHSQLDGKSSNWIPVVLGVLVKPSTETYIPAGLRF